ncbi:MAG: YfiR family protein [Rubrivivax sp.]|nr:YfiR family protein [Rubrivivax sp.]
MRGIPDRWWPRLLGLALAGCIAAGQAQTPLSETQAKASALFNFARYVEWPERAFASREAPLVFCLAGRDSLAAGVATFDGRSLGGRTTQLRRVLGAEDVRGCHVLYVGESEERRLLPMLRAAAGEPVLTVSDVGGAGELGGAITIVLDDGRIRFDINRAALEQAQLRASSNLLRLARNTRQP